MIVMDDGQGKFIVLEGNRRLAALKVLRDPVAARAARITPPELIGRVRETLDAVNVYRVEDRSGAQEIIGFKHINGPRPWDAIAKARYANEWLKREEAKGSDGLSLIEIADRMGDNNSTLRRMVTALRVLEQAEESKTWSVEDRKPKRFAFSHLYTGLTYPNIANYIGLPESAPGDDPRLDPVPQEKLPRLRELLSLLYGDRREGEEPVIQSQARDLKRLRDVMGHRAATDIVLRSRDLDRSFEKSRPDSTKFADAIYAADEQVDRALNTIVGFDPVRHADLPEIVKKMGHRIRMIERDLDEQTKLKDTQSETQIKGE
ncbi:MAG: hypothetical protein ACXIUW_05040 [Roseinatronobacter sp.]